MKKINWKKVGETTWDVCTAVGTLAGIGLLMGVTGILQDKLEIGVTKQEVVTGTYDNAVSAILNSNMMTSYKVDAVNLLKKDGEYSYYKAVIGVVQSDMMSSYKIDMIRSLSS